MSYLVIKDDEPFVLKDMKSVIKVILYIKYLHKGLKPFENDLEILSELFVYGCYSNKQEQTEFFDILLEKKLRNSIPSIRNKISEFIESGILIRPFRNTVSFSEDFLPNSKELPKKVGYISKITHAN